MMGMVELSHLFTRAISRFGLYKALEILLPGFLTRPHVDIKVPLPPGLKHLSSEAYSETRHVLVYCTLH